MTYDTLSQDSSLYPADLDLHSLKPGDQIVRHWTNGLHERAIVMHDPQCSGQGRWYVEVYVNHADYTPEQVAAGEVDHRYRACWPFADMGRTLQEDVATGRIYARASCWTERVTPAKA